MPVEYPSDTEKSLFEINSDEDSEILMDSKVVDSKVVGAWNGSNRCCTH